MTTVTNQTISLAQKLHEIITAEPDTIRAYIAREAINYGDESPSQMFTDLSHSGCQNGTISSLIYYADTHQFFDHYYDEIEAMREAFEDNTGEPLQVKGDLKNWLAWFAFEQVAVQLAEELNL